MNPLEQMLRLAQQSMAGAAPTRTPFAQGRTTMGQGPGTPTLNRWSDFVGGIGAGASGAASLDAIPNAPEPRGRTTMGEGPGTPTLNPHAPAPTRTPFDRGRTTMGEGPGTPTLNRGASPIEAMLGMGQNGQSAMERVFAMSPGGDTGFWSPDAPAQAAAQTPGVDTNARTGATAPVARQDGGFNPTAGIEDELAAARASENGGVDGLSVVAPQTSESLMADRPTPLDSPSTSIIGGKANVVDDSQTKGGGIFSRIGEFLGSDTGRATLLRAAGGAFEGGMAGAIQAGTEYADQQQARDDTILQRKIDDGQQDRQLDLTERSQDIGAAESAARLQIAARNVGIAENRLQEAVRRNGADEEIRRLQQELQRWQVVYQEAERNSRNANTVNASIYATESANVRHQNPRPPQRAPRPGDHGTRTVETVGEDGEIITERTPIAPPSSGQGNSPLMGLPNPTSQQEYDAIPVGQFYWNAQLGRAVRKS